MVNSRNSKKKKRAPSRLTSGYTLIEILVGLTIVTLLFSFGYVGFREFARRETITSAARKLKGELRLAQEQSLAGKKPDEPSCNAPNTLNGYNFRITSSTTYQVEAACTGGNVTIKQGEVSSPLTISTPSTNPILFKVLGEGTNIPSGDAILTITFPATGDTRDVTVSHSGEIQ